MEHVKSPKGFFQLRYARKYEAFGGEDAVTAGSANQGLLDAVHESFSVHTPLVLTPDSIWLTISQGVARHVTDNAEQLRKQFVMHEGKRELMISRDSFVRGDANNDWPGCWEEFSQQIRKNTVPKTYERLISEFSTTGPLEKAISNLTLMDTMSSYFSYGVSTACGIPKVTLLGTPEDWEKIYQKAGVLAEYDLAWWTEKLLPTLDQFRKSANGKHDIEWWDSFYKQYSHSGGDTVDGHILSLFPYIERIRSKKGGGAEYFYERRNGESWHTGTTEQIPSGMLNVPFTWYYYAQKLQMSFMGGLAAITLTPQGVKPACVWAVIDESQTVPSK